MQGKKPREKKLPNKDNYFPREAKARIMNYRLKVLLGWAQ
jgi:hypothetical protein